MKAKLLPLKGKYYGTRIEINFEDNQDKEIFTIWNSTNNNTIKHQPSVRELKEYGFSQTQWDENISIDSGWGTQIPIQELDLMCDSHYESKFTYERAIALINQINKK